MANELRIRQNFIGGLVEDNPLSAGATTLTSTALTAVQVIGATQHMVLILDVDGLFGEPEIVYITSHAANANTATILRGQEGSTARQHNQDVPWSHSATGRDFPNRSYVEKLGSGTTVNTTDWQANGNSSISAGLGTVTNGAGQSGGISSNSIFTLVDGLVLRADILGGNSPGNGSADGWQFGLMDAAQAATSNSGSGQPNGIAVYAQTYTTYLWQVRAVVGGVAAAHPNAGLGVPSGGVVADQYLYRQQQLELQFTESRRAGNWDVAVFRDDVMMFRSRVPYTGGTTMRAYINSWSGGTQGTVTIANPTVTVPGV